MTTQEWVAPDQWVTPTLPIGPRPAWVKSLGRYGRAAYEWNRRQPVIQLREKYYLDLQVWVETEVQALMEDWKALDPESEEIWERFGFGELETDHPLELRILVEPSVCRRMVYQPVPADWSNPYPWTLMSEAQVEMLNPTLPDCENEQVEVLVWKGTEMAGEVFLDEGRELHLDHFMPTAREVVVQAINDYELTTTVVEVYPN